MKNNLSKFCEARIDLLLSELKRSNIKVCLWKSVDRWIEGLEGKTDFDVLVEPSADFSRVYNIFISEGWVPTIAEPWRDFKGVHNFITFESGVPLHIHLHQQIVTGEKLVKSLRPPISHLYFKGGKLNQKNLIIPTPELELLLYICRTILKLDFIDFLGALKRRSFKMVFRNYTYEFRLLKERSNSDRVQQLLMLDEFSILPKKIIVKASEDITELSIKEICKLHFSLLKWREMSDVKSFFISKVRLFQKIKFGLGKRLISQGMSIAICGPDGSGKTTTVKALQRTLSRHLLVKTVYMGGNMQQPGITRGFIMKSLWPFYLVIRKCCKILRMDESRKVTEYFYSKLNEKLLLREKRAKLHRAKYVKKLGEIVLFERFPLFYPYGDDLPETVHQNTAPLEDVDLLVYIETELQQILHRRKGEDASILTKKFFAFKSSRNAFADEVDKIMVLNGNESLDQNIVKILEKIDMFLSSKAKHTL